MSGSLDLRVEFLEVHSDSFLVGARFVHNHYLVTPFRRLRHRFDDFVGRHVIYLRLHLFLKRVWYGQCMMCTCRRSVGMQADIHGRGAVSQEILQQGQFAAAALIPRKLCR